MQAAEGQAWVVCTQGRTKKEVWAERVMIDRTKDSQKDCESKD